MKDIDGHDSKYHNNEGQKLLSKNKYSEAEKYFERAIFMKEGRPFYAAHINYGKCLLYQHKFSLALQSFNQAKKQRQNDYQCHYFIGQTQKKMGLYAEALANYQQSLLKSHKNQQLTVKVVQSLIQMNYLEESEHILKKQLQTFPKSYLYNIALGKVLIAKSAKTKNRVTLKEAYDHLTKAVDKISTNNVKNSQIHLLRAVTLKELGDYEQAIKCLRQSLDTQESIAPHQQMAQIYQLMKQPQEAIKIYKKVLQIDDKSVKANLKMGSFYEEHGEQGLALNCYNKCLQKDSLNIECYLRRAQVFFKRLNYQSFQINLKIAKKIITNTLLSQQLTKQYQKRISKLEDMVRSQEQVNNLSKKNSNDIVYCCVCFVNHRNVIFLPCQHLLTCQQCYNLINKSKCIICRTPIESAVIGKLS